MAATHSSADVQNSNTLKRFFRVGHVELLVLMVRI